MDIRSCQATCQAHPCATDVQDFLRRMVFVEVPGEDEGIAWIELYTLFKMAGYRDAVRDPEQEANQRLQWERS